MKKFLSLVLLSLIVMVPLSVANASGVNQTVYDDDFNGTLTYTIDEGDEITEITLTIVEGTGAYIDEDTLTAGDSDFAISSKEYNSTTRTWTIVLTSLDAPQAGTVEILKFTKVVTDTSDCGLTITANGTTITEPDTTDTTTDNVQTGSTLPYIALGAIVVVAGVAYAATRNKSKMYKI